MKFFRMAWVVLAVLVLGLDGAGIPYAYGYYADVCALDAQTCFDLAVVLTNLGRFALRALHAVDAAVHRSVEPPRDPALLPRVDGRGDDHDDDDQFAHRPMIRS